jgi:hypothetical protein
LIKSLVQDRRVDGSGKRLLSIHAEPDYRPGPGCWVALLAARVPPKDGTALASEIAREGRLDFQEPITDELLDLSIAQDPRITGIMHQETPDSLFMVYGENPILPRSVI